MSEKAFNLFIYFEDGLATEVGARFHKTWGSDEEKLDFLLRKIESDFPNARRSVLPRTFTPEEWRAQLRISGGLSFFEPLFQEMRAPKKPVCIITPVVDGEPKVDQRIGMGPFQGSDVTDFMREGHMEDYLVKYQIGNSFDFPRLLDDDFMKAIRLLFQNNMYVSASKLLMSFIDTLAFVEFGDRRNNFVEWLDTYCDLSPLEVTAEEIWEYRNSVIHMTNLSSRAVRAGKVTKLTPYVSPKGLKPPKMADELKPFNLRELIDVIGNGVGIWLTTYNEKPEKIVKFIERYDTLISDSRLGIIEIK